MRSGNETILPPHARLLCAVAEHNGKKALDFQYGQNKFHCRSKLERGIGQIRI